ncbi:MAG: LPS-assembly protein LptD [Burkholderiales bacterium]|nr:LPS-assembly protein LptD [Burkholderiales bacterium]
MPSSRKTRIALAVLCALPLAAGAEQGLKLKSQPSLLLIPADNADQVPLFIEADRLQGIQDREIEAHGSARLRKRGQAFFADWMRHDTPSDVLTAKGNVRIEQGREIIEGESLRYEIGTDRGFMEQPRYMLMSLPPGSSPAGASRIGEADGRGTAERLLFEGPGQYRVQTASYTTCEPGNDAWFIRARQLDIDRSRDVGVARDASIVFFDQTIFYSPYLSFSLHQERKSGFLTPSYRTSNTTGFEFTVPYYWNIAPEMDATLYPRYMTKRGLQLGGEFRYLNPRWQGEVRSEVLASDQQVSRDRWALFAKHQQSLGRGWSGNLNINRVSDGNYFTDLSTQVAVTSQVYLTNDLTLARGGTWGNGGTYSFSAFTQRWQTLQSDPLAPLVAPYNRQPQLTLAAQRLGTRFGDFDLLGSYTAFDHPSLVNGQRMVINPSFSLPLQNAFAFVTPKIGAHITRYAMGRNNAANLEDRTRTLPIFSAETGVVFEREMQARGQTLIQTLEPKAYYVYIPYSDQSRLPNFESGLQDINFATLFTENQFSGSDRINDANQLTAGISSRFIDAGTGVERLRVALAQRYYFQSQQVTVPGVAPRARDSNSSDVLAVISGNIAKNWTTEAGWQYNTDLKQTQKFNVAGRYQPQAGKVLNLAYRDTLNTLRQADFSAQWPIDSRWSGVARWNYSIRDNRTLEAVAGVEYTDRCWALRIVGHRFATTTSAASTSIFVQLELSGISRIGTNPTEVLFRNISGYKTMDPRAGAPVQYNVPGVF